MGAMIIYGPLKKCIGRRLAAMMTILLCYYAFLLFLIALLIRVDKVFDYMEQVTSGAILLVDTIFEFILMCFLYRNNKRIRYVGLPMLVKFLPGRSFREYILQRKSEQTMTIERELLHSIIRNNGQLIQTFIQTL